MKLREHPLGRATSARLQPPVFGHTDLDLNRLHLTGLLDSEPLLCTVGDHPVARLTLAGERRYCTSADAPQVETTWFNLDAWEELADYCGRWLHKGDRIYAEGYLYGRTQTGDEHSFGCHTVVLERIVLLHLDESVAASGVGQTSTAHSGATAGMAANGEAP